MIIKLAMLSVKVDNRFKEVYIWFRKRLSADLKTKERVDPPI